MPKQNPARNVRGFLFYIMQLPYTARRASLLRPLFLLFYTLPCSFYFLQWCWFCNIAVHACSISFTYIFSKGICQHGNAKQIFTFLLCPSAFLWPAQLRRSWFRCAFFRRFFLRPCLSRFLCIPRFRPLGRRFSVQQCFQRAAQNIGAAQNLDIAADTRQAAFIVPTSPQPSQH